MRVNVSCSLSSDFDIADSQSLLTSWYWWSHVGSPSWLRHARGCRIVTFEASSYGPGAQCTNDSFGIVQVVRVFQRAIQCSERWDNIATTRYSCIHSRGLGRHRPVTTYNSSSVHIGRNLRSHELTHADTPLVGIFTTVKATLDCSPTTTAISDSPNIQGLLYDTGDRVC